ncbi:MAG: restriction endonuclease subunit S, partial [Planctomycetota bacterium]
MMADVPEHWVSTTVLEIAELVRGVTYKKEQARDESGPGLVPLLRANNIKQHLLLDDQLVYVPVDVVKDDQRLRPNDVVLAMSSGSKSVVGKTARFHGAEAPFTFGAFCGVLRPSPDIDSTYFALALQSPVYRRYVSTVAAGVNINNLRRAHLEDYQIPVSPLLEQQAIAAKVEALFSELDAGVAHLEAARALLTRYRQSVLKAAFEGRLTAEWRAQRRREAEAAGPGAAEPLPTAQDLLEQIEAERRARAEQQHAEWVRAVEAWEAAGGKNSGTKKPRRPARPKDPPPLTEEELESLPELPEGWVWVRLASISEVTGGLTKNAKRASFPMKVPYLRVANVYAGRLELAEVKSIGVTADEMAKTLLKTDDLLFVEGNGSADQIGRVARWTGEFEPVSHQNHLIRARCSHPAMAGYLLQWFLSPGGRTRIMREASSTSGLHTLSISKISMLPVPVAPMEEQDAVAHQVEEALSGVSASMQSVAEAIAQATALRQSILKRAFEGRLLDEAELEAVRSHPD